MVVKDNFSVRSSGYAKFRPVYPQEMADWLMNQVTERKNAWDCGTGNGQFAGLLSGGFQKVYATDISTQQINNAVRKKNIFYFKTPAEKTAFPVEFFNLVTVAQAIHWFNFDEFYQEVRRTAAPGAVLAVPGYSLLNIDRETDRIIRKFYEEQTGPYWDAERKYIDDDYKTIPFPFEEIKAPAFKMEFEWDLDRLTGYIQTWSGVQHFIKAKGFDPVPELRNQLFQSWKPGEIKKVRFPLLLRVGKVF